jgi:hypothetical protein
MGRTTGWQKKKRTDYSLSLLHLHALQEGTFLVALVSEQG